MSLITYDFDLLVTPIDYPPIIKISQYDDSRTYVAHLKNDNGSAFQLASGATATFEGVNSKGVAFQIEATVDGDKVSFTPSEAATDQYGKINASICIKSGGEQLTPLTVRMEIQKAGATHEDIARSPGFTDVIDAAVENYMEQHGGGALPPGGQAGQVLVSDGQGGADWVTLEDTSGLPNGDEVSY